MVNLTPQQQERLAREAARMGLTLEEYVVRRLLGAEPPRAGSPRTPADAVAYWRSQGLPCLFQGKPDSAEYARQLRSTLSRRHPDS